MKDLNEKNEEQAVEKEVKLHPKIKALKDNFERFNQLVLKSEVDAVLLVKKWLGQLSDNDKLALKAVSQQLEEDDLYKVFLKLSESEREIWKQNVDGFLNTQELITANKYISEEVVRDSIAPQGVSDVELIDLLLSLDIEVAVNFVKNHRGEAKTLLNLLQPKNTAKILDQFEYEESKELIKESLTFDLSSVSDDFKAFKEILKDFIEGSRKKPFNMKILQMLPNFNPNKENMLYKVLAKDGQKKDMKTAALSNFPSDLIVKLPSALLKEVMQSYEAELRIQLLAAVDEATKDLLLNSFAEEGSAAREMVDLEFENLEGNEVLKKRIQGQREKIWQDFVYYVRTKLKSDEKYTSDLEMIINDWVNELCQSEAA